MTTVLVIGATGKQGGAVADLLLQHGHDVTALVRSPDSPPALALAAAGARVVTGHLADPAALAGAAKGADAVFGLSVPFGPGGKDAEGHRRARRARDRERGPLHRSPHRRRLRPGDRRGGREDHR
ncbi:uncharacterized protein YbjT (DUF2867 family) [Allocatelliglobosispora scoriae]|uniref:Uncharacterized protein YbjT (DUF2867 family) n=1 Tax=Allocatelliglobosispora scoriae TaxID=643052 RepID=A0A841C398_9ACTN|nr:NmrA family NAD(P)-binding protein [Allocatelliglobosispora scoriae]MBB5873522.1 uncharacterized protein YbjT (DUF2867 family) [Allocatelliglobosispora scoriae]